MVFFLTNIFHVTKSLHSLVQKMQMKLSQIIIFHAVVFCVNVTATAEQELKLLFLFFIRNKSLAEMRMEDSQRVRELKQNDTFGQVPPFSYTFVGTYANYENMSKALLE